MMSRLFVTMKLGRDNFFWASLEILNMSWMGQRKLWMQAAGRDNILRLVAKAEGDAAAMRQKYEVEAVAKGEELEMT